MMRFLCFPVVLLCIFSCKKQKSTPCVCTREYNPVCAGAAQYANPCLARCDGYGDDEMTFILSQEQIDSGLLVTVDCSV